MFEVYATTPERMSPADIGEHARRAEAMGYDGLHVPDAVHDGLLLANNALMVTTSLQVGTGVLLAFPRSPMVVAVAAWDLQAMSKGRFELGLGTQIKQNIVDRYSATWTAPVAQLQEYIEALRAIFTVFQQGGKLNYEGKHYRLTRLQPFFNPGPIEHPEIPILMGAIGPKMTQMAGQLADGMITHPTNTPPQYIREVVLPRLTTGAGRAGRSLDDFKLMLGALVATGPDEKSLQAEREKQRGLLGFLFSTPAYWPSLELFGWSDRGQALQKLTRTGKWQEMASVIDDEMLDQFVPSGTYETIAELMKARYQGLSTRINFPIPDDPAQDERAAEVIAQLKAD
jgi:probable F420-dependent oxidoreductase